MSQIYIFQASFSGHLKGFFSERIIGSMLVLCMVWSFLGFASRPHVMGMYSLSVYVVKNNVELQQDYKAPFHIIKAGNSHQRQTGTTTALHPSYFPI